MSIFRYQSNVTFKTCYQLLTLQLACLNVLTLAFSIYGMLKTFIHNENSLWGKMEAVALDKALIVSNHYGRMNNIPNSEHDTCSIVDSNVSSMTLAYKIQRCLRDMHAERVT